MVSCAFLYHSHITFQLPFQFFCLTKSMNFPKALNFHFNFSWNFTCFQFLFLNFSIFYLKLFHCRASILCLIFTICGFHQRYVLEFYPFHLRIKLLIFYFNNFTIVVSSSPFSYFGIKFGASSSPFSFLKLSFLFFWG